MHPEVRARYESLLYDRVAIQFGHDGPRNVAGSDMLLHLPVLSYFASLCDSALELGTRDGHSTLALLDGLAGRPLTSIDLHPTSFVDWLRPLAGNWSFVHGNTRESDLAARIAPAGLVLVDTLHTDAQVRRELELYGPKATRFIAFHDTETCGDFDKSGQNPLEKGISEAIRGFTRSGWALRYSTRACNGLQVFERTEFSS